MSERCGLDEGHGTVGCVASGGGHMHVSSRSEHDVRLTSIIASVAIEWE